MKWLTRLKYKLPKYRKNVWYNSSIWMSEIKYPKVFNENKEYIDCKLGLKVLMGETKCGKNIYYEVVRLRKTPGSDWIYDSDNINCDLRFLSVETPK